MEDFNFRVKIPKYKTNVVFIISDSLKENVLKIKKKHRVKRLVGLTKKEVELTLGVVIVEFQDKNLYYVLVSRKRSKVDISVLTHEIFHLTMSIMQQNDKECVSEENEEYCALLNGYLNSMIISKLLKNGEKFFYKQSLTIKIS